jgi:hypothetical protein
MKLWRKNNFNRVSLMTGVLLNETEDGNIDYTSLCVKRNNTTIYCILLYNLTNPDMLGFFANKFFWKIHFWHFVVVGRIAVYKTVILFFIPA